MERLYLGAGERFCRPPRSHCEIGRSRVRQRILFTMQRALASVLSLSLATLSLQVPKSRGMLGVAAPAIDG